METNSDNPKINKYKKTSEKNKKDVDLAREELTNPSGMAPLKPQTTKEVPETKPMQNSNLTPEQLKELKKKQLFKLLWIGGGVLFVVLVASIALIWQTGGSTASMIPELTGMSQVAYVNTLGRIIHIIFLLFALTLFTFSMTGLFKATMAKKEDVEVKKAGMKKAVKFGAVVILILVLWAVAFVIVDGKRVSTVSEFLPRIVTTPEETLGLTAPLEIKFDASKIPVTKGYQVISYEWNFGDGQKGTSLISSHTYDKKGRYDAVLTVTSRNKQTGEEKKDDFGKIIVIDNQAISAIFTADPQSGEAPLEVEFDGSDSVDPDGTIEEFEWDLDGNGRYGDAEGEKVTHTFEKSGKYTVSLRVVSSTGESATSEKEIIVEEAQTPQAVITVTDEPERFTTGVQYIFKSEDSTSPNGKIEKYEWDFGDGSQVVKTKTVTHSYLKSGSYDLKLTVTDEEGEQGETILRIDAGAPQGTPKAIIRTEPKMTSSALALEGKLPFTVTFDGADSTDSDNNIVDYEWDFDGDGKTDSTKKTTSHTYNKEGVLNAKLTVTDADGNKGVKTIPIKVLPPGLSAKVETDRVEGNVPLTVQFNAGGSSYPNGKITSYQWDFGDGTKPKLGSSVISHKYTSVGAFTAKVTVIGADNSKDETTVLITVREIPLTACFDSVFKEGPAPLTTSFDPGCSTGTAANFFWNFGDGSTSTAVKPEHTFEKAGEYNVTLELTDVDNTVSETSLIINVK